MPVYKEDISCKHLSYVALISIGIINYNKYIIYTLYMNKPVMLVRFK